MRLSKTVIPEQTLSEAFKEFIQFKMASKMAERTIRDYRKNLERFLEKSQNSLDCDKLKQDILAFFPAIPDTSPAVFNHPYEAIHAAMNWLFMQDKITAAFQSIISSSFNSNCIIAAMLASLLLHQTESPSVQKTDYLYLT